MKTIITIIAMALTTSIVIAQMTAESGLLETLDTTIPEALDVNKVPGLAIAIIKDGEVIIKKGYGFADVAQETKVEANTGFNVGSISKIFTAWGIMRLAEEGKIVLDNQAADYISNWKLPASEFASDKVTIRNLLQHTAGLSVHGYNGYESKSELTSIRESLSGGSSPDEKVTLILEPESEWQYSGGGYSILQLVIEEVSGQAFADYMDKNLFRPLRMSNTSFTLDKKILKNSAKTYDEEGRRIPLRFFNAQAAAGLHTTLEDLILFAKASFIENPVLSKKSLNLLISPTELSEGNYGMGYMEMNRFGDFTLNGHGGSNEGWHSGFMLDFESKSGIIILTNGSSGRNVLFGSLKDWAQWHSSK